MRAPTALALTVAGLLAVPPGLADARSAPAGRLTARVRLAAPAASVLTILGDVTQYPLIFKSVRKAEVVAPGTDGRPSRWWIEVDLGWPLGMRWMSGTTRWQGQEVVFHRTSGTLERFDGTLRVLPEGRRTCLAVYDARFDLGPPRPPSWLGGLIDGAVMPGLVADARRYLSSIVCDSTSARCQTGTSEP